MPKNGERERKEEEGKIKEGIIKWKE